MPYVDEPMDPIDPPPQEPSSSKRRPSWLRETLEDAERHIAPRGSFHESKKSNRPLDKSVVTSKWLYKIKHEANGSAEKFKARIVARGFFQKEGVDYDEIFAHVAQYTTIRSIIALAASQGWNLHQMDVKTTFLHGLIKEEVYVEQPEGFEVHDRESHVCRLKKALYGLR
eukprot:PITA_31562